MAHQAPHDVLGECLERWESGQGGVEDILAQHPAERPDLEALLQLATELPTLVSVRAPERLRRDPLWRRGLAAPAAAPSPISLPQFAAERAAARLAPHDALRLLPRPVQRAGGTDPGHRTFARPRLPRQPHRLLGARCTSGAVPG